MGANEDSQPIELEQSCELPNRVGGTHPADDVHEQVIEIMREEGFDLSERTPREITSEDLRSCLMSTR
jgi:arsenate reductase